ncbi:sensor histidine kinase [Paenibacillus psychroresistens]|nr:histidine kinase [Paenibacillus psychroresistens]
MKWMHLLPNRKKRLIGVILAAILLVTMRFVWPFVFNGYAQPKAVQGVMDLRQWDFQLKGKVKLRGDWTFVPNQFISPAAPHSDLTHATFVKTPHLWNAFFDNKKTTPLGYASYRLNILLPKNNNTTSVEPVIYAFKIQNIRSAHTLFVNGVPLGNLGIPGKAKASYKPENYPYIVLTNIKGNEAEVILHVANFDHQMGGGILLPLEFGTADQIITGKKYAEMSDTAIIVLLLLLAIFCGFLFSYQSKQRHLLYFMLFCLSSSLYLMTNSEKLLIATAALPFNVYTDLQMLTTIGIVYFAYKFIIWLYPELSLKSILLVIQIICVGYTCLFLFTPMTFYSLFLPYWYYFLEIMIIYMLAILLKAVWIHREDAPYLFLAAVALMCNGITYILQIYDIILPFVPPIDLMIFALSLMLLVTHRFVETMEQVKNLSLQRVRIEMAFLQAQIKPHFLFNSLNTIGSFIETEPYRAQDLLGEFSTYLRFSFDFTNLEPSVPFDREWTLVEAYLKLEQARFGESLQIYVDVAQAKDIRLPPLSLQPLIENAIRHGVMKRSEGGSIRITARVIDNEVELAVEDSGIGIPNEQLVSLLSKLSIDSDFDETPNTSDVNGIGLKNIQHRLVHTYGKGLIISSIVQQGTLVKFRIPKETAKENDIENTFG